MFIEFMSASSIMINETVLGYLRENNMYKISQ
jgi:hypothetical protein